MASPRSRDAQSVTEGVRDEDAATPPPQSPLPDAPTSAAPDGEAAASGDGSAPEAPKSPRTTSGSPRKRPASAGATAAADGTASAPKPRAPRAPRTATGGAKGTTKAATSAAARKTATNGGAKTTGAAKKPRAPRTTAARTAAPDPTTVAAPGPPPPLPPSDGLAVPPVPPLPVSPAPELPPLPDLPLLIAEPEEEAPASDPAGETSPAEDTVVAGEAPSAGATAAEAPTAPEPDVEPSSDDEPVAEEPVVEVPAPEPFIDEPLVEAPAVEESAVEESVVEEPAPVPSLVDTAPADAQADPVDEEIVAALATDEPLPVGSVDPAAAAVSLRGVVKQFGDTRAVDGIDLTIPAGSFYGIVGPNGAGKTTTLSMIAGLLGADRGTITVCGVDAAADPARTKRMLGVLPDRLRTFDRLTGHQLLYYYGVLRGLEASVVESRVSDLARVFDLTESLGRPVSDYSAGMTKKVMLAGAMIHSPRVLVLDEPFEAVDPASSQVILDILTTYVAHGGTVVLSSHGMALVERVCSQVAVLVGGQVLAEGAVDDVRGDLSLEERFIQLSGGLGDVEGLEWLHTFSD